jgi:hypothetical protein
MFGPPGARAGKLPCMSQSAPQPSRWQCCVSQLSLVVLLCFCSIAGFYMPDNVGGSNISLPANSGSCLPCPVRAALVWLPMRHAAGRCAANDLLLCFSHQVLHHFAFCRSTRISPILARRPACCALRVPVQRTLATPLASLAPQAFTHPPHVSTAGRS